MRFGAGWTDSIATLSFPTQEDLGRTVPPTTRPAGGDRYIECRSPVQ
jgi:hypothetical protein